MLEAVARIFLAERVDLLLRRLQDLLRRADALLHEAGDLTGGRAEVAQQRLVADDGAVLLDVRGGRRDL